MTTSGIYSYQISRDDIIAAAIRKLGVIADGQAPSADNITNAIVSLNAAVAELRSKGMPLWARSQYTFTPIATQKDYNIGVGQALNTPFPVHLLQAFRQDGTSTTKIFMEVISNYNYNLYPTNQGGTPIQITYQPLINSGVLSVWPIPDTYAASNSTITIVYQRPFQYFNSSTDTMDFPEEWYNAIIYKLATLLAPEWSVPLEDRKLLMQESQMYIEQALENGQEDASLFVQPDPRKGR